MYKRQALQGLAVLHHGLDGVGGLGTRKLLFIGLAALDNRDGQVLLADVCVAVQLLLGLSLSLGGSLVDGVALLSRAARPIRKSSPVQRLPTPSKP